MTINHTIYLKHKISSQHLYSHLCRNRGGISSALQIKPRSFKPTVQFDGSPSIDVT